MNDRASMLCQECDNVFHKSAAKKSHIRIPVQSAGTVKTPISQSASMEKLAISRGNSTSLDLDDTAHGQGSAAAGAELLKELNEYCRAPLQKYGVADPTCTRLVAPKTIALGNEFTTAVAAECVDCIVIAGLRGILDDREVRFPQCTLPCSLWCQTRLSGG
jgi:hypothetical protein